ncbi:CPXCG motif-containing cysteine-rich protein [bacterium]|nr:CPXCG motif-containing cysteine-rich protein [bacterium]
MSKLLEHDSSCPFCNEPVTFFIDPSQSEQTYIEDCTVCCRPIQVTACCDPELGELLSLEVSRS